MLDGFREVENHFALSLAGLIEERVAQLDSGVDYDGLRGLIEECLVEASKADGGASAAFYIETAETAVYLTAGDTRIYWLDRGQRTTDHSRAQDCIDLGKSPSSSLSNHPLQNILTRTLSTKGGIDQLDEHSCNRLAPNESVLFCTDGFWRNICDESIFLTRTANDLEKMFLQTIGASTTQRDNSSVLLLRKLDSV